MASGDTLSVFHPLGYEPPANNYATVGLRNNHAVLQFDAATAEAALWSDVLMRGYDGGGITVTVYWMGTSATSGNVVWDADFERDDDEGLDLDSDSFATAQTATGAAPGTSGLLQYTTIAFTSGQIDSLVVGEAFRFRLTRDAADGSDTMAGDAEVKLVELRET